VAVRSDELVGGVARVRRDGQRALRLECGRYERLDRRVASAAGRGRRLDDDGAAAELELVLADELLLLLLPHATMATALSSSSAASSGFLQVLIRLLLVETETPVRGGSE
jgi:hypothetical protein